MLRILQCNDREITVESVTATTLGELRSEMSRLARAENKPVIGLFQGQSVEVLESDMTDEECFQYGWLTAYQASEKVEALRTSFLPNLTDTGVLTEILAAAMHAQFSIDRLVERLRFEAAERGINVRG